MPVLASALLLTNIEFFGSLDSAQAAEAGDRPDTKNKLGMTFSLCYGGAHVLLQVLTRRLCRSIPAMVSEPFASLLFPPQCTFLRAFLSTPVSTGGGTLI